MECLLNHAHGYGVLRCGRPATHWVRYGPWPRALASCAELAHEAHRGGAEVVSFDHVRFLTNEAAVGG